MITNVDLNITTIGFEITAIDDRGETIRESYIRGPHGFDCIQGNFADERALDDHAGLLMALEELAESAKDVAEQLRLQKETNQ